MRDKQNHSSDEQAQNVFAAGWLVDSFHRGIPSQNLLCPGKSPRPVQDGRLKPDPTQPAASVFSTL